MPPPPERQHPVLRGPRRAFWDINTGLLSVAPRPDPNGPEHGGRWNINRVANSLESRNSFSTAASSDGTNEDYRLVVFQHVGNHDFHYISCTTLLYPCVWQLYSSVQTIVPTISYIEVPLVDHKEWFRVFFAQASTHGPSHPAPTSN